MNNTHKALIIFCTVFFLYAEYAVYQHYLVINRDYFPVMSEFYKMYAVRFGNFVQQMATLYMTFQCGKFVRKAW